MPFKKGQSGNPSGREKGIPNKTTQEARIAFHEIMSGNIDNVKTALEELYKTDKVKFLYVLSKYFPYFIPRQEQIDIFLDNTDLPFNIKIESRKKTDTK